MHHTSGKSKFLIKKGIRHGKMPSEDPLLENNACRYIGIILACLFNE